MGNKTKFGDSHLSERYQNGQFCHFIDDAIVSRSGTQLCCQNDSKILLLDCYNPTSQLNYSAIP